MSNQSLLRLPDTKITREADRVIQAALPADLRHHSVRTHLLGRAWAGKKKISFDEEDLYLAALFHDVGLCESHRDPSRPFTANSVRALRAFTVSQTIAPGRVNAMAEAIEFHMQLLPRFSRDPVVGLLQVGAWMDLTGLRKRKVAGEARLIEQVWPRQNIARQFPLYLIRSVGSMRACTGLLHPALGGAD